LSSQAPPPGVKLLQGSYYEIGQQMGARLEHLEVPEADEETVAFALDCEAVVADVYPALLDKVEGMIDGGKHRRNNFKALFYARDSRGQMGCTNLAVPPPCTADGSLLVGINYDWYYYALPWREVRGVRPQGAHRSLRVTHHWAGSPDGLNETGLGVFLSVLPQRQSLGPGLSWHLVMDIVLDTCRDVPEARGLLASLPHLGAFNYLIVDALGHALVAEALPGRVTFREPENGCLLATNHLPGREAPEEGLSEADRRRQERSVARYKRTTGWCSEMAGQVDETAIRGLLRDHEAPICRGNHNPPQNGTAFDDVFGTIWSLTARPADREIHVAWGHPCRSDYMRYGVA
jgi:isopenicillin-N N-acyltransferase-like protein